MAYPIPRLKHSKLFAINPARRRITKAGQRRAAMLRLAH